MKPYFWKFQFQGAEIRKSGYRTEAAAKIDEAKERLKLEALSARDSFISLAESRLVTIQAYSTPLWFTNCCGVLDRGFNDWYELPASDITPEMVRTRIIKIGKEQSHGIANRSLIILSSIFRQAIKDGILVRNPAAGVDRLPVEKSRKVIPKREDIDKVIDTAKPLDKAYLEIILFTGARVNEVNALTWADVDFERRTMKLWTRKKKGGNKKDRNVHMVQRVYDALIMLAKLGEYEVSPWVFNNPEMKRRYPAEPAKWRYIYRDKFLKTLCRSTGVPEFTYHHLRHYTASALDAAGVPLSTIQKILGHESAVTTNNYLQDLGRADTALEVL